MPASPGFDGDLTMSDPTTEQEPTMEEILASIRRIISEDGENEDVAKADAAESDIDTLAEELAAEISDDPDEDILELTDEIEVEAEEEAEEDEVEALSLDDILDDEEPEAEPAHAAAVESADAVDADDDWETTDDFEEEATAYSDTSGKVTSSLLADPTIAATTSAFATLAGAVASSRGLQMGKNATLEDMVKDMLRPILKDWLDQNLPQIVQRIVEREVSKLADRADDDK